MQPKKLLALATLAAVAAGSAQLASCTFEPRRLVEYDIVFTPQAVCVPIRPWMGFRALFDEPQRILIGLQKGEETKPVNEHYEYTDLYVERVVPAGLQVVCMDAPPDDPGGPWTS